MKKKKTTISPLTCARLGDFISFRHNNRKLHVDIVRKTELFNDNFLVITMESGGVKYKAIKYHTVTGFILECKPDLSIDTSDLAKEVDKANFAAMHQPGMLGMGRYIITVKGGEVTHAEFISEKEA